MREAKPPRKGLSPRPMGRPRFEPTPEQRKLVRSLVSIGVGLEDIATLVEICTKTLATHFYSELQRGRVEGRARNTKRLHVAAENGNVTAMIWLDKTRFGIREPSEVEIGKKQLTEERARDAHVGSEWDDGLLLPVQ